MSITIQFVGDVDRLPHKDLAEHLCKLVAAEVTAAEVRAGVKPGDRTHPCVPTTSHQTRNLLGDDPYRGGWVEAKYETGVHLPEPAAAAEGAEK